MPDPELTELVFILDRSGSMGPRVPDVIGGYNSLISKQAAEKGRCRITLWLFDTDHDLVLDNVPIELAPQLSERVYFARGSTALRDAIGRCISGVGERLAALPDKKRPGKVIVTIMTDGLENASMYWTPKAVKDLIEQQREKYNWQVIFLGANQDSLGEAPKYGVATVAAMDWAPAPVGVRNTYAMVSNAISRGRGAGGQSVSFSAEERATSMATDDNTDTKGTP